MVVKISADGRGLFTGSANPTIINMSEKVFVTAWRWVRTWLVFKMVWKWGFICMRDSAVVGFRQCTWLGWALHPCWQAMQGLRRIYISLAFRAFGLSWCSSPSCWDLICPGLGVCHVNHIHWRCRKQSVYGIHRFQMMQNKVTCRARIMWYWRLVCTLQEHRILPMEAGCPVRNMLSMV